MGSCFSIVVAFFRLKFRAHKSRSILAMIQAKEKRRVQLFCQTHRSPLEQLEAEELAHQIDQLIVDACRQRCHHPDMRHYCHNFDVHTLCHRAIYNVDIDPNTDRPYPTPTFDDLEEQLKTNFKFLEQYKKDHPE